MAAFPTEYTYLIVLVSLLLCFQNFKLLLSNKPDEASPIVYELEEEEFEPFLIKHDPVMVMFYSPNCGHCHKMKPEYEKLPNDLKQSDIKAYIARVDASENRNLITEQNIEGFPTLKLYSQNNTFDYKGDRTSEAMTKWIKKITGEPVMIIANETEVSADSQDVYFVGFFEDTDSAFYKSYVKAASENRLLSTFFAVVPSPQNTITAVKEDGEKVQISGQTDEEIKAFIQAEGYPKLAIITPANFEKFLSRNLDFAWFESTKSDYEVYGKEVRKASKNFKNEFTFVWVDSDLYSSKENGDDPSFILNLLNGTRYQMEDAKTSLKSAEIIVKFLTDAKNGLIEPFLKSEEIPPEDENNPLVTVVGKTVMKTVFQPDKDVLLEVYAPWCGHCKQLEPAYIEVAEHFKDNPNVVIAKLDGSANESPTDKLEWQGFPTIFFVKAGSDTPIQFNGQRSKQGLIDFVMEKGTKKAPSPVDEL